MIKSRRWFPERCLLRDFFNFYGISILNRESQANEPDRFGEGGRKLMPPLPSVVLVLPFSPQKRRRSPEDG